MYFRLTEAKARRTQGEREPQVARKGRSSRKSRLSPYQCSSIFRPQTHPQRPANYSVRKTLARNPQWRGLKRPPAKISLYLKRCRQRFLVKLPRKHTITCRFCSVPLVSETGKRSSSVPPKGKSIKGTRSVRFIPAGN